jgi:membrane dipeptidase
LQQFLMVLSLVATADPTALHRSAVILDLHADTPLQLLKKGGFSLRERLSFGDLDLPRLREGNVAGQFFVIFPDPSAVKEGRAEQYCRRSLDAIRRAAKESGGIVLLATPEELRAAREKNQVGGLLGIEGADCLSGRTENLAWWREQGVRYLGLTWNTSNPFATAAADRRGHGRGLTVLGRALVAEANRLGVLVDVSHASKRTFWDAYRASRGPLIASHSSSASLRPHLRNLDDEQARAIARSGGVIGVNYYRAFVKRGPRVTVDDVAAHVVHLVRVAGPDHVGLGSDFDGLITLPDGLEDVSKLPNLTAALVRAGLSERDIRAVLGENVLRALSDAGRDVHRGPRIVPLPARWRARHLVDRNDRTEHRLRGRADIAFEGKPTHFALVPCGRGEVRVQLWRGRRAVWDERLALGQARVERPLPSLGTGRYRARLSGRGCLREATFYGP